MSDYSSITLAYNSGTDASPSWTGTALAQSGSAGANEVRFAKSGTGATTSTASASWPLATKPSSGTDVYNQAYAFTTDTSGTLTTYTGDNTVANMFRISFSNDGTLASAPQVSFFDSSAHTTPTPGTQPSIVNGSTDTSNRSYMKMNFYGPGAAASGSTQYTPSAGSVGAAPTATTGTTGAVTTSTTGSWISNWQDGQGWLDYVVAGVTPQATFAFYWYFVLALFFGANMSPAMYSFTLTLQYTFS